MTRAYVDTTVLVNILLKRGPIQKSCVDSLSRYQSAEVPTYALKEMKAGPLYAWIWLHNKCVACQSCAKVLRALHGMASSRKRNLPLTAIEAWEEIARSDSATLAMLVKKYGRDASDDVVKCERLRLGLRRRITTAWRDRHRAIPVVEPLACYEDSDLEVDKFGMINPWPIECDPTPNCSLAAEMAKEPSRIRRLHAAVESCPAKAENTRRLKKAPTCPALFSRNKLPSRM
jgi:hypothetical protein